MTVMRVGLVGCASTKLTRPAPARDLYTSQLFRKASAYAEGTCDQWFILSAKHGLVQPDTVLEPYDMKLGRSTRYAATNAPPFHDWAARVRDDLTARLTGEVDVTLVVLAGALYEAITYGLPWPHEAPLNGLGIGQRLAWLTQENAARMEEE